VSTPTLSAQPQEAANEVQQDIKELVVPKQHSSALMAEAIIAMAVAQKSISFGAAAILIDALKYALEDCPEALSKIQLKETKLSYIQRYGLSVYFREDLFQEIKSSLSISRISLSFDETTNAQTKSQMDFFVRYFSQELGLVVSRYVNSYFLDKKPHEVLLEKFDNLLALLDIKFKDIITVSRDGCATNNLMMKILLERADCCLVDHGSCVLHKVFNVFQVFVNTFAEAVSVDIFKLIQDLVQVMKLSSCRRADYERAAEAIGEIAEHIQVCINLLYLFGCRLISWRRC
jgi:hypothetical protein